MPTDVKDREERSHSARYMMIIFLVCVAVCGLFFSMGFLVGLNEREIHLLPATEVVNTPAVVPPTVNPPPDSSPVAPAQPSNPSPNAEPETEVVPPGQTPPPPPAAKAVEITPPGTPEPAEAKPAPASPSLPVPGGGMMLQVAALRTQQDAQALVDVLKARGYSVFLVTPASAHADDSLYRVQVGPFRTRDDADKVRAQLTQDGFKPFVKH